MRHATALITAAGLLIALTSCSAEPASGDCVGVAPGESSSLVEVTGAFGELPEVSFPTPLTVPTVQKTVVSEPESDAEGEGEPEGDAVPLRQGQPVAFEATILDAADGTVLDSTVAATDDGAAALPPGVLRAVGTQSIPALGAALECVTVGSRVAIVMPGSESVPEGSEGPENSIVIVVDVLEAFPSRADGRTRLPESGMPGVTLAPDGTPGITIPLNAEEPTEYRKALLKSGYGDVIADDDVAVVKYASANWSSRESAGSSWLDGEGVQLDLRDTQLAQGLRDAVVGERVGSQVLAVIPAADTGGETVVYVLDILGTRDY